MRPPYPQAAVPAHAHTLPAAALLPADLAGEPVLLISGDRHWAELSVESSASAYPIYDLTSSSLNQVHPRGTPTANRFRSQPTTYHRENFGAIRIDWEAVDPSIELQILDLAGEVKLGHTLRLSELAVTKP